MFILVGKADLLASLKNFGVNLDLLIKELLERRIWKFSWY